MLNGRVIFKRLVIGYRALKKRGVGIPEVTNTPLPSHTTTIFSPIIQQIQQKPLEVTGELKLLPPETLRSKDYWKKN
ncbi:MAG: hypothetical protein NTW30_01515 [Candidatus Aenigmarchaeota archaeon]|nr:hypothetical protein [Candidatus Aenigmarchaeota archaeon]